MPESDGMPALPAVPSGATLFDGPLAFVDVETTGGGAGWGRIIEIASVAANGGVFESEWSTLVDPGMPIPFGIQSLTGITDEMVQSAPVFEQIAAEVLERLQGRLFVAHNARFDYGFVRGELKRAGLKFSSPLACTVKLSRRLYPEMPSHNLDALIGQHSLRCSPRHRALPDAQALWQFWGVLGAERPRAEIDRALEELTQPALPPAHLRQSLPDELPEGPGVYLFYGADGALLYAGKADDIRQGVLEHWGRAKCNSRARRLVALTARVEWLETAGEVGARLAHARFARECQPRYNRTQRTTTRVVERAPAPDPV